MWSFINLGVNPKHINLSFNPHVNVCVDSRSFANIPAIPFCWAFLAFAEAVLLEVADEAGGGGTEDEDSVLTGEGLFLVTDFFTGEGLLAGLRGCST